MCVVNEHRSEGSHLTCFLSRDRYHYEAQGSIADGELIPAPLVGSKSTCPVSTFYYMLIRSSIFILRIYLIDDRNQVLS
jgi:hypothetical protein